MPVPIPDKWRYDPPEPLVVGDGPYSAALATVLGVEAFPLDCLRAGPEPNDCGSYPRIFHEDLERAVLVIAESMSIADSLQCHQSVWEWISKLSSSRDEHKLAFIFILPPNTSKDFEAALAVSLSVPKLDPATTGHAAWLRSGSLSELLKLMSRVRPIDLVALRNRRTADPRHSALAGLRTAVAQADLLAVQGAAREVLALFLRHEYQLDAFCQAPAHRKGNELRKMLHKLVTNHVTPSTLQTMQNDLPSLLL